MKELTLEDFPSPSGYDRADLCPGSVGMENVATEETSPEAERGTLIHAVLEKGEIPEGEKLSEEEWDIVVAMERWRDSRTAGASEIHREIELPILLNGIALPPGHADVVAIFDTGIEGLDYKSGWSDPPEGALVKQGMGYAIGAYQRWKILPVTWRFFQPRLKREYVYAMESEEDYGKALEFLTDMVNRQLAPNTRLVPGSPQCRYCRAREFCPAFWKWVKERAKEVGRESDLKDVVQSPDGKLISALDDPHRLARLLDFIEVFMPFAKRFKDAAKELAATDLARAGWRLKESPGDRYIMDAGAAVAELEMDPWAALALVQLPIGKLSEWWWKEAGKLAAEAGEKGPTKAAASKQLEEALGVLVNRRKPERRLERIPESEKALEGGE